MIWKRALLVALLAVSGLALETSVLADATLAGTKPPLLLLVVVAIAAGEGVAAGAAAGFWLGLATDLVGAGPAGITALTYTLIGYGVGRVRAQIQAPSVWLPVALGFGATFVGGLLHWGLAALLGAPSADPGTLARHVALGAAYNALLTPFVFPFVRALARRLRPRAVAT